jgi:hypothetical protein
MSNTNIKQQARYKINKAWPVYKPANVEDCLKKLVGLSLSGQKIECHGAPKNWRCIRSTLDIRFKERKIRANQRMKEETRLLKSFVKEADPHLPPEARRHIEIARLKWKRLRNTGTVFVGRHYGLPTRCVDWTSDPLVALFFACRRHFKEPGVVWWMDYGVFSHALATQWPLVYEKKKNIEDDFERDFVKGKDKEVLIRFHYPKCLLERPTKQKAHIIMSGQYDVDHDKAIHQLCVRKCGRFIIRSQMKSDLLNELNRLGINGATLGIGDLCVETIATDIADKLI